jgi:hypothetical protein
MRRGRAGNHGAEWGGIGEEWKTGRKVKVID